MHRNHFEPQYEGVFWPKGRAYLAPVDYAGKTCGYWFSNTLPSRAKRSQGNDVGMASAPVDPQLTIAATSDIYSYVVFCYLHAPPDDKITQ